MSRPFSYNDENFTVIGNMLFCHIKITFPIASADNIAEVPPEIVDRLLHYTNTFLGGELGSSNKFVRFGLSIRQDNGKYYLYTTSDFTGAAEVFAWSIYYLKDI